MDFDKSDANTTKVQLGQSNRSITDGPAECDNQPSPMGQGTRPTFHEFGVGNDWAKSAMRHRWAARKRAPHTMGRPTLAGLYGTHALRPLVLLLSPNLYTLCC